MDLPSCHSGRVDQDRDGTTLFMYELPGSAAMEAPSLLYSWSLSQKENPPSSLTKLPVPSTMLASPLNFAVTYLAKNE